MIEKYDHACISRFDALIAPDVHAIDGNGSSLVFAAAQAYDLRIYFLGFGSDLDPDYWPIFRNLDEAWKSAGSKSALAKKKASKMPPI